MNLTVCCVLADGPVRDYDAEYVDRLQRMVARYLRRPYQFVCLTDGSRGTVPCDTIAIPSCGRDVPENTRGIWAKLHLFNKATGLKGRCLYLDLDTIVVADLAPIVDYPARLALTAEQPTGRPYFDTDRYGRRIVRRFNSSVIVWDAGSQDDLYDTFSPRDYHEYSTDQDWIGMMSVEARGMPYDWFPRISQVRPPWPKTAKVILCKKPKNRAAVARWPELAQWWG